MDKIGRVETIQYVLVGLIIVSLVGSWSAYSISGAAEVPQDIPTKGDLSSVQERLRDLEDKVGRLKETERALTSARQKIEDLEARIPPTQEIESVSVDPTKTALVIIDMQNDFCKVGGAIGPADNAGEEAITEIALRIKDLKNLGKPKGMEVIYTQDYHLPDDPEFELWGPHCVVENGVPTWGQREIPELEPAPDDHVVHKGGTTVSYNAFFAEREPGKLEGILRDYNIETVIVTGTVSNICVYQNVTGFAKRGYRVIVPVDGMVSLPFWKFTPEWSLFQWTNLYGVTLTKTGKIVFA